MKPVKAWAIVLDDGSLLTFAEEVAVYSVRSAAIEWADATKGKTVRVEIREVKPKKRKVPHVD